MPRISALTSLTTVDSGDLLPVVDVSASVTKKATKADMLKDTATYMTAGSIPTAALAANAVTSAKIDFTTFSGTTTQWRSWTPTLSNFTGTVNVARYTLVGKTCHFYIKVTQGASVTGQHRFTLPVEINSNLFLTAPINSLNTTGYIEDSGTAQFQAQVMVISSTVVGLIVINSSVTYAGPTATSATIPMNWASGLDSFLLSGTYETI